MDKLIFVCYEHGLGGENLSYRISKHTFCDNLLVKIEKGRTVIKNDIFNKIFLGFNNNFQYSFQDKEKLCKKIIKDFKNKIDKIKKYNVVPSHIDADTLKKFFINSYFIGFTDGDQYYSINNITTNESWSSTVEYLDANTPVHADVNFQYTPTVDSTFEITSTLTDANFAYIGTDNLVCSVSVMVMGASGVSGDDPALPTFPTGSTGSQGATGPTGASVLGRASYDTVYGYSSVH